MSTKTHAGARNEEALADREAFNCSTSLSSLLVFQAFGAASSVSCSPGAEAPNQSGLPVPKV